MIVVLYWVGEFARHIGLRGNTKDFLAFYQAGRAVLEGSNPYHVLAAFYNPPWVAVWMAPFATMPVEAAQVVWNVLGLAAVAACGWICYRVVTKMAGRSPNTAAVAATVLAVMVFYPLRQNFDSVQSDVLPLVATFLCVVLDDGGHQFWAGVALMPGLFDPHLIIGPCVYLLVRGRWRAVTGAIVGGLANTALAAAVLGPSSILEFVHRLGAAEAGWAAHPYQVTTIHTLLAAGLPVGVAYPVFFAIAAVAVVLAGWTMRRPGSVWRNLALCAALTDIVIPFGFAYDFAPALLALPWVVERLQEGRLDGWTIALAVFGLSIYFGGVSWVRYPVSHDLLHSAIPLCVFPALWVWRDKLAMSRQASALALTLWMVSDVVFGGGNPFFPLWMDSLAFNLGVAALLAAMLLAAASAQRLPAVGLCAEPD